MKGERPLHRAQTAEYARRQLHLVAMAWLLAARGALAQELSGTPASAHPEPIHPYLLGAQATEVVEAIPRFKSPYAGMNSLRGGDAALSQTYTLYLGIRGVAARRRRGD